MSKCKKCGINEQILESSEADLRCSNQKIAELESDIEILKAHIDDYRNEIVRLQAGSDICQSKPDIHIEIHNAEFKL